MKSGKGYFPLIAAALCVCVLLSSCSSNGAPESPSELPVQSDVSESSAAQTKDTAPKEEVRAASSEAESAASSENEAAGEASSQASSSEAASSEENSEPPEDNSVQHQRELTALDTYVSFTTYGGGESALDKAESELNRLEQMLSVTNKDGEIGKLNSADGRETPVSKETQELLTRSLEVNRQTDGTFDIRMYPVLLKWGFTTGENKVPSESEIKDALSLTGSDKLKVSDGSAKLAAGSMVDLGGIAKGYVSDRVGESLKKSGVENALFTIGGSVRTIGTKPDGSLWKVGIADPNGGQGYVGVISVSDTTVSTSGIYERYFEKDGTVYGHILDPKTGTPVDPAKTGILSTTVVSADGTLCDALSTALFVMGRDRATAYLEKHKDIDAVLITTDGSFIVTGGLADSFKTTGSYKGTPITYI